jgi:hypothetical protein
MSRLVDELKLAVDCLPWPSRLEMNSDNWEQAKRELPTARDGWPVLGSPFGLRIVADDSVPENEIHFISIIKDEHGEYRKRVDKIVNIGPI